LYGVAPYLFIGGAAGGLCSIVPFTIYKYLLISAFATSQNFSVVVVFGSCFAVHAIGYYHF